MQPGIYKMADKEYFAVPAASNSTLKLLGSRSPAHWAYRQANPTEPTANMLQGTSLHCAILEPERFMEVHAVLPDNAPRKPTEPQWTAYKEGRPTEKAETSCRYWEQWNAMSADKIIINDDTAKKYMEISERVRNHPELRPFFNGGQPENAVFANDPVTGVLCKCKPDYLTRIKSYNICIELKSTEDARKSMFKRTAFNFGYYQAAAFYQDVMEWSIGRPDLYLIVAFERDAPYGIKVYEIDPYAIERGTEQYRDALNQYAECLKSNLWPNYSTDIEILDYPAWAKE
jgi:hypothetical protein